MMRTQSKIGILLVNLGTPATPTTKDIRDFLYRLLNDPNVLNLPRVWRWLLLHMVILPFRPKRLIEPYEHIWTDRGSPFMVHTNHLVSALQNQLGELFYVLAGMQCSKPTIESAMQQFRAQGIHNILALPMYPQYAASTTGSAIQAVKRTANKYSTNDWNMQLRILPPFYSREGYINSLASLINLAIQKKTDLGNGIAPHSQPNLPNGYHVLFSYHGLPVSHIKKVSRNCMHPAFDCCKTITDKNQMCYRAQCHHTTEALARILDLNKNQYSMSFQSRLGRAEWLQPATAELVTHFPKRGIKDLLVVTPSFTVDCLETLEEIGMQAKKAFLEAGGNSFILVPCLNATEPWVKALAGWLSKAF